MRVNPTLELTMSAALLSSPTFTESRVARTSRRTLWAGRIITGIAVAFLVFDTVIKLIGIKAAVEGTVALGYTADQLPIIAMLEVVCLALYLIPRTAPLGAVLWTGYLGGAVATHFRLHNPLLTHVIFPIYVAALLWGGLYLRDARVRALLGKTR
jgi:hypothetical protein